MRLNQNQQVILIFLVFVLIAAINGALLMLCCTIAFQVLLLNAIIKDWKTYKRTKSGKYVMGRVIECRKIPAAEDSSDYELTIAFALPSGNSKYQLKHSINSLTVPPIGKEYTVWINEAKPEASVVLDQYRGDWVVKAMFFFLVAAGLFVLDYIMLMKLIAAPAT